MVLIKMAICSATRSENNHTSDYSNLHSLLLCSSWYAVFDVFGLFDNVLLFGCFSVFSLVLASLLGNKVRCMETTEAWGQGVN